MSSKEGDIALITFGKQAIRCNECCKETGRDYRNQ